MVTGKQVKAARLLLNWRQVDLADQAHTTQGTIGNVECGRGHVSSEMLMSIRSALEKAGVEFPNGDNARLAQHGNQER
jgi:transcriptional regulator with XRE-family HTH domain